MSAIGNGAVVRVIVVPNAPTNPARDILTSTPTAIGITWTDGASNGGSPIIDYQVLFDQGTNNFTIASAGITTKAFVRTGLTSGVTY